MGDTRIIEGPWSAEAVMSDDKHDICLVNPIKPVEETGWPVVLASVYSDDISKDEADSIARLIAAAPDLFDCLQGFLHLLDMGEIGNLSKGDNQRLFELRAASDAALAKARGEQ